MSIIIMSTLPVTKRLPSHANVVEFLGTLLPPQPQDIPLQYHVPRWPGYDPATSSVHDIVLSITPTRGVYEKLHHLARGWLKAVTFLHRPFDLDRRALPRGSLALASHKRFDELLTVGYNTRLARSLGMLAEPTYCVQGYKGDSERRIGIVGQLAAPLPLDSFRSKVLSEFGIAELHDVDEGCGQTISAVAIMNAFGPDEVKRVIDAAQENEFVREGQVSSMIYLTGQAREPGLHAARAARMPVICVGHRAAEEWGIRRLSNMLVNEFQQLQVHIVLEEEQSAQDLPPLE